MLSYLGHRRDCQSKQLQRQSTIAHLPELYKSPHTAQETALLSEPISTIASRVQSGELNPRDVLLTYARKALQAHADTNCLTEIMLPKAEEWAEECNKDGPLAGVPVSLKDTTNVEGYDSCIGYSSWIGLPATKESTIVRLLRDAGAVPYVKTNIPITLMSFESSSDVWGATGNPHNTKFVPGGSSGGEAALLAYGGSRVGIGSDVAGSVRLPSHFSGTYTIKSSTRRFSMAGGATSIGGQEGVLAVQSPMARTLGDLEYFWKAVQSMRPWLYDQSVIEMPWRDVDLSGRKLKWGIMWEDGVVTPSPACARALREVVAVLRQDGHEVVTAKPPSPYEGLKIGSQLVADGCDVAVSHIRRGESNDPGMAEFFRMLHLPRWLKRLYVLYLRYIAQDEIYAGLVENLYPKTLKEYFKLVTEREAYRESWFNWWQEEELEFLLTVPNATPAFRHKGIKDAVMSCGYTFLFNILDYSAGVMPVTHVDQAEDRLLDSFKPSNNVEKRAYSLYDAKEMHGLPVGVQVVGKRLEEEKVMEGMKLIERLLAQEGNAYQLLEK